MINKTKYLVLLFFILQSMACKKYLDKKSDSSLIVPASIKDLQGLLDDVFKMNQNTAGYGEGGADDFYVLPATYNGTTEMNRANYQWTWEFDYNWGGDWAYEYPRVYNANYCLELIDKIRITDQNEPAWKNIKGSAYFFRAFAYLNLVWVYAKAYDEATASNDLGIVLRTTTDFNVTSVRANVKDSYEQIIADFKGAAEYLSDFPLQHVARPSKAAAFGGLARVYWSMRKYEEALYYANEALKIKSDLLDYNGAEVGSGNIPFAPLNKEIIFYSTRASPFNVTHSTAKVDSILYKSYDANDKRKTVFFYLFSGGQRFKGSYAAHATTAFSGIATDELFLIRAEGYARTGNTDAAIADLNRLLKNRYITNHFSPLTASTPQQALDLVLKERRKELISRALRWPDIKRLNKEGRNITLQREMNGTVYTLPPNSNKYAVLLPGNIIDITGMPQNPQ